MTLHERKILETQNITISFDTDHGTLIGPAGLATLPSQSLTPDSHSNVALVEDEEWAFELIHREIYDPSQIHQVTALEVSKEFEIAPLKSESGKLLAFPPYEFRDNAYRVTLKDRTVGLHKSVLTLRGKDGVLLDESPIIWQRFAFLSANPSTVRIAARPVRVFLRCPDESVELSKVRSAPTGIKAVVSSPREVTVMLDANAPGIIDGAVVVETTAAGRPPLKIPVIRYAPTTDAHAGTTTPGVTPRRSRG